MELENINSMGVSSYEEFLHRAKIIIDESKDSKIIAAVIINFEELFEFDSIFGHCVVDNFLQEAAERLVKSLRPVDSVGFFGRYQLVCVLPNLSNYVQAELAGHKITRIFDTPFIQNQHEITLLLRVGVAIADRCSIDSNELIRQAHSAMNQSCRDKVPLTIYSSARDKFIASELELLADFERAIKDSRLYLTYQPLFNLQTGKIDGAEALLRWTHPELGSISPVHMIHLAEKTGIMPKLTFWVLHTALRQCSEYRKTGLNVGISVNISAQNLNEPDFIGIVSQLLKLWNVPPEVVCIEITETAIMNNPFLAEKILNQFKNMGLIIAMDDFGTGYSSLAILNKLPIDKLKIDKSFIINMLQNQENEHIVESIISLAHNLGIIVIAEGVEDVETLKRLYVLKCDYIQGYLISSSLPLTSFIELVSICNKEGIL